MRKTGRLQEDEGDGGVEFQQEESEEGRKPLWKAEGALRLGLPNRMGAVSACVRVHVCLRGSERDVRGCLSSSACSFSTQTDATDVEHLSQKTSLLGFSNSSPFQDECCQNSIKL